MLPLFLLLLLGWHYFQLSAGKTSTNQDLVSDEHSTRFQRSVTRLPFRLQNSDVDLVVWPVEWNPLGARQTYCSFATVSIND